MSSKLQAETLKKIDDLLKQKTQDGVTRGLYTESELKHIHAHLTALAKWLEDNEPEFLKKADKNYTHHSRFNEKTVLCISYIDHIQSQKDKMAAQQLQEFFNNNLSDSYSHLHILPHFPSPIIHEELEGPSSRADGGFEATHFKMDEKYGHPNDVRNIDAELMFDFVMNHLSVKGDLFQKFLEDEEGYEDFFVTIPEDKLDTIDLSPVFRPREHHPIIPYTNSKGKTKHVWCTFSETQADINLKDYRVFCFIMESLVKDFVGEGASWIRLDAIGYLVKMLGLQDGEPSTSSFGIDETHNILKVMNLFLRDVAPSVTLVPEVNATEQVIKTYYGENNDEGHLVYEFPSAPLSLFTIYNEDATSILDWAKERNKNPEWIGLAFTNSHDGVGVLPMGDVPDMKNGGTALDFLIHQIERRVGGINYKSKIINGKTKRVPYEACITWLQAVLTSPERAAVKGNRLSDEEIQTVANRYMASHSFVYTAPHCVPADYIGAIVGLLNDEDLYFVAGHRRNKNRGLIDADAFINAVQNPKTSHDKLRKEIFERKNHMIKVRQSYPAFSPYAKCKVDIVNQNISRDKRPVYSVLRHSPHCDEKIITLTNCTEKAQKISINAEHLENFTQARDILTDNMYGISAEGLSLTLAPHQVAWLKAS